MRLKRILASGLAVVFILGLVLPGLAVAGYPDVDPADHDQDAIDFVSALEIMTGWGGRFHPDEFFLREQLVTVITRIRGLETAVDGARGVRATMYADAHESADHWSNPYLIVAYNRGFMVGERASDGTRIFRAADNSTRDEVYTILIRTLLNRRLVGPWPQAYRDRAVEMGLVTEAEAAMGDLPATRGEIATLVHTALTQTPEGIQLAEALYVYGDPHAIELGVDKAKIPANGESEIVVTATVVDDNGVRIRDYNGTLNLSINFPGVLHPPDEDDDEWTVKATKGVAEFTLVAGNVSGIDLEVTVQDSEKKLKAGTIKVSTVAQKAAKIEMTIQKHRDQISADGKSTADVTAKVLDQDGVPMNSGVWDVKFEISGVGTWSDGTVADKTVSTGGNQMATVTVMSRLNRPGTISVAASIKDIPASVATVQAVLPTSPTRLGLSVDKSTIKGDGTDKATFTVRLLDDNGKLVTMAELQKEISVEVTKDAKVELSHTKVQTVNGVAEFTLTSKQLASVTVVVKKEGLTSASQTISFKPGDVAGFKFVRPELEYWGMEGYGLGSEFGYFLLDKDSSSLSVEVQLVDKEGNPVPSSKYYVKWVAGYAVLSNRQIQTNSQGRASVTFHAATDWDSYLEAYLYVEYKDGIFSKPVKFPEQSLGDSYLKTPYFGLVHRDELPHSVVLTLHKWDSVTSQYVAASSFNAGDEVIARAQLRNHKGDVIDGDTRTGYGYDYAAVKFTVSGDATDPDEDIIEGGESGEKYVLLVAEAARAGSATMQARVINVLRQPVGSRGFSVQTGPAVDIQIINTDKYDVGTAKAEESYEFAVRLVDAGGNPVIWTGSDPLKVTVSISGLIPDTAELAAVLRKTPTGAEHVSMVIDLKKDSSSAKFYVLTRVDEAAFTLDALATLPSPVGAVDDTETFGTPVIP